MSLNTIRFDLDIVAMSSIVHRGGGDGGGADSSGAFRTEKVFTPEGELRQVPIVSGSSFRGVLRRIGEELTAAVLDYEDVGLPVPAAHLLTNGGRLSKSATPITDEDERRLKALLPQIAVFGGAASGRIMSGLLTVGKVLPEVAELAHILPRPPRSPALSAVYTFAEESFTHLADHRPRGDQAPRTDENNDTSPLGRFDVETLPAGTILQTWVRIAHATLPQVAFLHEVLSTFASRGHLGGRIAAGNGNITAVFSEIDVERGQLPDKNVDWRAELAEHRAEAIEVLSKIT